MSMTYFVHINQQSDGSLPPDKWVKVVAGSMTEAIVEALSNRPDHNKPAKAFVAIGNSRHIHPMSGLLFTCQSFALTWGKKRNVI